MEEHNCIHLKNQAWELRMAQIEQVKNAEITQMREALRVMEASQ